MNISVIIPTYNRKNFLKSCLQSLFRQSYPKGQYEIIVVDDGSTDGAREMVQKLKFKNLRYYYQKNQGPAAARNLGIKHAQGKIIAFTDDDCIVDQDWLRSLVEKLIRDKKIVGAGGRILAWKPKNLIEKYAEVFLFGSKGDTIKGKFQPPFLVTANCAYYAKTIKKIGLFDSSSRLLEEDLDLSWRLNFLGYQFAYAPSAIVYHRMPQTLKSLLAKYFLYGRGKTAAVYKHQNRLENKYYCSIKIKDFIIDDFIKWPFLLIKWPKKIAAGYQELPPRYKEKKHFYFLIFFLEKITYRFYRLGMFYQALKMRGKMKRSPIINTENSIISWLIKAKNFLLGLTNIERN